MSVWVTKQNRKMPQMIWTGRRRDEIRRSGAHWRSVLTHRQAMSVLAEGRPDLAEVMRRFGSAQVRASGTSAAISPTARRSAICADADRAGRRGGAERPGLEPAIALEDFFVDYGEQDRAADEFVSALWCRRH